MAGVPKLPFKFRSVGPAEQAQIDTDFDKVTQFIAGVAGTTSTPAEITADEDDYDTGDAYVLRLSTDATRTITGFADGSDGLGLLVINVGSNDLVLADQDAGSSALNRIITGHGVDITLDPDAVASLRYDGTTGRWRVTGTNPSIWS